MKFDQLGLSPKALAAVTAVGFEEPTPIQEQAIPVVLAGGDVLGLAQTGTGKTASFTLPILTRLETGRARARMPRILILEPTRELAAQVHESFEQLGSDHKLTIALLIGGVSFADQDRKLGKGADVLIATPGRLLDHFERGKLMLNGVEVLVVDEADRMLDMGFIPDIERICKLLPLTRQTLFFSATMPPEIQRITKAFLRNPTQIQASPPSSVVSTITQSWVKTPSEPKAKRAALRELIESEQVKNAIVFCNRKRDVATLERSCERHKLNARALHGDMNQHARLETLKQFRDGEVAYLIASDVAARGLDIPEVSHVFNFDVPDYPEDYIHRIGRTGRAGKEGHAISLVTPPDMKKIAAIEKLIGKQITLHGRAPGAEEVEQVEQVGDNERGSRRGRGRGRGRDKETGRNRPERDKPKAETAPAEKKEPQRDRPEKPKKRAEEPRSRSGRKREDGVVGLGDHVPAFLQKSTRR